MKRQSSSNYDTTKSHHSTQPASLLNRLQDYACSLPIIKRQRKYDAKDDIEEASRPIITTGSLPTPPEQQSSSLYIPPRASSASDMNHSKYHLHYSSDHQPISPPLSSSGADLIDAQIQGYFEIPPAINGLCLLISRLNSTSIDFDKSLTRESSRLYSDPLQRTEYVRYISDLAKSFKFHSETSWIAVYYFDRYLSRVKVLHRRQFFLIAIGCLYLASKMEEEILEPNCSEIVKRCSDICSAVELRRVERKILNAFNWDFTFVTPHAIICHLVEAIGKADQMSEIVSDTQAMFDKLILDIECLKIDPFVIGVACLQLQMIASSNAATPHSKHPLPYSRLSISLRSQAKLQKEMETLKTIVAYCLSEFQVHNHDRFWEQVEFIRTKLTVSST